MIIGTPRLGARPPGLSVKNWGVPPSRMFMGEASMGTLAVLPAGCAAVMNWGASTAPAGSEVGMYEMGSMVVGHDCELMNCRLAGAATAALICLSSTADCPSGSAVLGDKFTCIVETGTLNASVKSGFCWTGEVAV